MIDIFISKVFINHFPAIGNMVVKSNKRFYLGTRVNNWNNIIKKIAKENISVGFKKRLLNKIGMMNMDDFKNMKNKFKEL